MKVSVKNVSGGPRYVHAVGGAQTIENGKSYVGTFSAAEIGSMIAQGFELTDADGERVREVPKDDKVGNDAVFEETAGEGAGDEAAAPAKKTAAKSRAAKSK